MRLCPTAEGSPSPLITHRITPGVCLARQRTNFHKCHKCIYRGKAVDWQAEEPEVAYARNGSPGSGAGAGRHHQISARSLEADA